MFFQKVQTCTDTIGNRASATGTEDSAPSQFAPSFAPNPDIRCKSESIPVNTDPKRRDASDKPSVAVSACEVVRKEPSSTADNGLSEWAMTDSNRRRPRCKRAGSDSEPVQDNGLTPTPSDACTTACTSDAENVHGDDSDADQGDTLSKLADALANLSPEDRAKLAAMLNTPDEG